MFTAHAPRHFLVPKFPHILTRTLLLFISLSLLTCTLVAQDAKDVTPLEQGKPIERELAGDAVHTYSIMLAANQFVHLVVEQKGIDVVVTTFSLDGKQLNEVDSPNGTQGPEPISILAETAGSYRLKIRALETKVEAGRYQVKVEELRTANPQDKFRIAAQQAFTNGEQFRSEGSAQSLLQAIGKYQEALPLWRAAGEPAKEAETLMYVGIAYNYLGEKQKAVDYYNQALLLMRAAGNRIGEANLFNYIGGIYDTTWEKQKALDNYTQALLLFRALGDRGGEATTLINIGGIYGELGQQRKALEYYNQALPLMRAVGDRSGEASALTSIGLTYDFMGEPKKSLDCYNQALSLERAVGDRAGESTTLNNLALAYHSLGELQKALDHYNQALQYHHSVVDRRNEGVTLDNIGLVYDSMGDKHKALEYYKKALPLSRAAGDLGSVANVLANIAFAEGNLGNLDESRTRAEEAIAIIESFRTKLGGQELRSSYYASILDRYEGYIELLMRLHEREPSAGHEGEALQASERVRARSLLETLAEAGADIHQGVDQSLVEREFSLQRQVNEKAQAQMMLLLSQHTDAQSEAMASEIERLTTEYQRVQAEIRQKSPGYLALTQPQPLTLKEIQTQVLDNDTMLLEYSLEEERSFLWAVTPTSIASYVLPKQEVIDTAARRVYASLNARNQRVKGETQSQRDARVAQADSDFTSASLALSEMVLAPVASQLGKKRLAIVADGVLQYIPFAVLPVREAEESGVRGQGSAKENPNRPKSPGTRTPLIVDHEIVTLPSASTLDVIRREVAGRKPAPKTVVAIADPVFVKSDVRVKGGLDKSNGTAKETTAQVGGETIRELQLVEAAEDTGVSSEGLNVPRLPGSRKEAEEIVAMVPASERKIALDFDANRATATSAELSQYRYIHFSTHGFLNSVHPELSGIVFSLVNERGEPQDGFLRAHEVFNLKLPAELVVLSACQTGIGKEVKGEGLVSLTRGFMYAGAPRVVVSLWSVSENGTAELMVRFYREMLKNGKRPAEALRAAQISLMKEKKWSSPFYWAAFTLQGEWK